VVAVDLEATQEPPTNEPSYPAESDTPAPRRPSEPLVAQDRYQLGTPIATGGMGEVVTAFDADIGREVAIKRLRAPHPTPLALARFLREARIQGRLDHPAIVPVHELSYDTKGRPYFVMKKLAGTTLAEILASPTPKFTRKQLLRAFADVCLAIEFAHTRGVVHRDIKPANILLGDFGEVYVLDWGIARVATDSDDAYTPPPIEDGASWVTPKPAGPLGTPGYMAPEQVRGEHVDARADVYALGCVLFEIVAGCRLHPRGKAAFATTLSGIDARPSRRGAQVAPELDQICARATAPAREQRLRSARELGEAVQHFLDGDRDGELRGRLAREHLAYALAAADDDQGRRVAMRQAGQALALDPGLSQAAELVGRLMLEPPKQMPAQVAAELADVDRTTNRRFVLNLLAMHASFFVVVPLLWALGVRDRFYFGMQGILSLLGVASAVIELRTRRDLLLVHNTLLVLGFAVLARVFSPFIVTPAAVAMNIFAFAFHPRGASRRSFVTYMTASMLAVLAVWIAERVGWISPTVTFEGGALIVRSPLDGIESFPVETALTIYLPIAIVMSAMLAFSTARLARAARERTHLQAWQLRQLVPLRRSSK
jgi:eukaryotic-like serine/threonine-protein kinase